MLAAVLPVVRWCGHGNQTGRRLMMVPESLVSRETKET